MWSKFQAFFDKLWVTVQHILGLKPSIPSSVDKQDIEKFSPPESKTAVEPLTFRPPAKYESIDWENNPPKYRKKKGLQTYQEQRFFNILLGIPGEKYNIFSMVRMADVMYLSDEAEDAKYHKNNIQCKHFDFVICDREKSEPLLVIELDDPKHGFTIRRPVDKFKDKACQEAGIPILRFEVRSQYNTEKISQQIQQLLSHDPEKPYSSSSAANS